jgi:actin related protein 2/3 complex subunit 2
VRAGVASCVCVGSRASSADFDGVRYHLFTPDESALSVVHVSISWSVLQTLLKQGAQAKLQKEYGAFLIAAEAGYDITLKLDTAKITAEVRESV